jgi:tRNA threonylcarbamoyladenosine biosynthesis protein TsaE
MQHLTDGLAIDWCGPERATEVHALTQAAFAPQAALDPPSGATRETLEVVRADLAEGPGVLAWLDLRPVGAARTLFADDHVLVRRVAVDPSFQRRGIGGALMAWIHDEVRRQGKPEVRLGVRKTLTAQRAFYAGLGYRERSDEGLWVGLCVVLTPDPRH